MTRKYVFYIIFDDQLEVCPGFLAAAMMNAKGLYVYLGEL